MEDPSVSQQSVVGGALVSGSVVGGTLVGGSVVGGWLVGRGPASWSVVGGLSLVVDFVIRLKIDIFTVKRPMKGFGLCNFKKRKNFRQI